MSACAQEPESDVVGIVSSNNTTTATTPDSSVQETFTPEEEPVTITLTLPISPSDIVDEPEHYGILPYGVKIGEHPEGHTGLSFEVKENISIKAAADGTIIEISEDPLFWRQKSIIVSKGDYKILYDHLINTPNFTIGQKISKGKLLGNPGEIGTLGYFVFRFSLLDRLKYPMCPDFKYWDQASQDNFEIILNKSVIIENNVVVGKYDKLCY